MFAIRAELLPRVRSYSDAVELLERQDCFDSSSYKPLGRKDDRTKCLYGQGSTVHFRYRTTDVVNWHSPNHLSVGIYPSVSTANFIERFTPPQFRAKYHRKTGDLSVNGCFARADSIDFHCVDGIWAPNPDDVTEQYKYVIDRSKLNELEPLRAFLRYRDARDRMLHGDGPMQHRTSVSLQSQEQLKQLLVGELPPEHATTLFGVPETDLVGVASVFVGALRREPLSIGVLPKPSRYDAFHSYFV